jgi:hypothetical protein
MLNLLDPKNESLLDNHFRHIFSSCTVKKIRYRLQYRLVKPIIFYVISFMVCSLYVSHVMNVADEYERGN